MDQAWQKNQVIVEAHLEKMKCKIRSQSSFRHPNC